MTSDLGRPVPSLFCQIAIRKLQSICAVVYNHISYYHYGVIFIIRISELVILLLETRYSNILPLVFPVCIVANCSWSCVYCVIVL